MQERREENINSSTYYDNGGDANNNTDNSNITSAPRTMKGLNYLDSIPQVTQHAELMLWQFFLDSVLAVGGDDRNEENKVFECTSRLLEDIVYWRCLVLVKREWYITLVSDYKKLSLIYNIMRMKFLKKFAVQILQQGTMKKNLVGYPQLIDYGGFELMSYQSNSRQLIFFTVFDSALSVKDVRAWIEASQFKVDIGPILKNLT